MRRIIACVIIGLVTAIALYHLIEEKRSIYTNTDLPADSSCVKSVKDTIVIWAPMSVLLIDE